MGLRWLNGHAVSPSDSAVDSQGRKKRLIVEFAIENAQVVMRRQQREDKARERSKLVSEQREKGDMPEKKTLWTKDQLMAKTRKGSKRKRPASPGTEDISAHSKDAASKRSTKDIEKAAKRQKIIGRKRMSRKKRDKA